MMNNPLMQMVSIAKNGGNPMGFLQQMATNNPMAAQAAKMLQGKSNAELQQMAVNMCKERGTTPDAVLQQLGLR